MKHVYALKIFALLLFASLFTQCSMRTVSMNAMRPADITFPSYVNTLVLVDRTKFDKNAVNILEGVLTGELPGEDRAGVQATISSLQQSLMMSPRFQVKVASEILNGNSITSAFPAALSWANIEELCAKYGADAVVAMEIFDTDFILTNGKTKIKKQITDDKGETREIETDGFYAQGVGNITIGIRLYDPKAKSIVDQQLFTRTNTWKATGSTLQEAAAQLIGKAEATRYLAGVAGSGYAYKIAPMPVRLDRQYYVKPKKVRQLNMGGRQAQVNDWKGAIATWQGGVGHAKDKEAGRLCYNIAVAYEVLGDLDAAKQWASKAYVDYGNKKARAYSAIIEQRKVDEETVKQQMH